MGTRQWIVAGGVLLLALTGTLGLISHERLSRQEALDAAGVREIAGRRVEAKLMHFADLARAYPIAEQRLSQREDPIAENELVWVIVITGWLISGSCGVPEPGMGSNCPPNWTLLVVRDRRTDLPPAIDSQAGTRASIIRVDDSVIIRVDDSVAWPSFFHDLPDLEFAPLLI